MNGISNTQLPTKFIGDTIEFLLTIGVDMTSSIGPSNPGGRLVSEDGTHSVDATYTAIDAEIGKFYMTFNTTGLPPGNYKLQIWWAYSDDTGFHSTSSPVYSQVLEQRISGPP